MPTPPAERRAPRVVRWLTTSEAVLAEAAAVLDQLNVFPVPDADTGANLHATVAVAADAVREDTDTDVGAVLERAAAAAIASARGNSGTLFAVALAGMAAPLRGHTHLNLQRLADSLERAELTARSALSEPAEGTLLSVLGAGVASARASLAAAEQTAREGGRPVEHGQSLREAVARLVDDAYAAVVRTESQLPMLADAHVVDAGAVGMLWILESLRAVVEDDAPRAELMDDLHGYRTGGVAREHRTRSEGVEVMCTLDLDPLGAATLRHRLTECGDSVIVAPVRRAEDPLAPVPWRVHVHVDAPRTALDVLEEVGVPADLTVTALDADAADEEHHHEH